MVKETIQSLKKNDKVTLVYTGDELFEGYVHSVDVETITIHEYVSDVYRTFHCTEIIEIEKV